MDSCPLAFCIWHTAVRPGRSPGWHGEQMEHPLQRGCKPRARLVPGSPPLPSTAHTSDTQGWGRTVTGGLPCFTLAFSSHTPVGAVNLPVLFLPCGPIHNDHAGIKGVKNNQRPRVASACHGSSAPSPRKGEVLFL